MAWNKKRAPMKKRNWRRKGKGKLSIAKARTTVLPDKMIVKLPYVDYTNYTLTGGAGGAKKYCLNSIYDPEPGTINDQPMGFDEWGKFYSRYRVFKVDYEATILNLGVNTSGGITATTTTSIQPDYSCLELPYTKRFSLGAAGTGGAPKQVIRGTISLPKLAGLTSAQYKDEATTGATWNTSPGYDVMNLFLSFFPTHSSLDTVNCDVVMRLTYHVELFDRNQLNVSSTAPSSEKIVIENISNA